MTCRTTARLLVGTYPLCSTASSKPAYLGSCDTALRWKVFPPNQYHMWLCSMSCCYVNLKPSLRSRCIGKIVNPPLCPHIHSWCFFTLIMSCVGLRMHPPCFRHDFIQFSLQTFRSRHSKKTVLGSCTTRTASASSVDVFRCVPLTSYSQYIDLPFFL
jgi:hypothetical protein